MSGPLVPGEPCPNCDAPSVDEYCPTCGQRNLDLRVPLRHLLADAAADLWGWDSRAFRTFRALLWPPGGLTRAFLEGKRARFVPPFRLYLICSLIFFLTLSATGSIGMIELGEATPEARAEMAQVRERLAREGTGAEGLERRILERVEVALGAIQAGGAGDLARGIRREVERSLPKVMFFLLPVFALILKVLYVRGGWMYAEHIILALHYHAFVFALFTVPLLAGGRIPPGLVTLAAVGYLPLAMDRTYDEGWIRTGVKALLLTSLYFAVCGSVLAGLVFVAFLRL